MQLLRNLVLSWSMGCLSGQLVLRRRQAETTIWMLWWVWSAVPYEGIVKTAFVIGRGHSSSASWAFFWPFQSWPQQKVALYRVQCQGFPCSQHSCDSRQVSHSPASFTSLVLLALSDHLWKQQEKQVLDICSALSNTWTLQMCGVIIVKGSLCLCWILYEDL